MCLLSYPVEWDSNELLWDQIECCDWSQPAPSNQAPQISPWRIIWQEQKSQYEQCESGECWREEKKMRFTVKVIIDRAEHTWISRLGFHMWRRFLIHHFCKKHRNIPENTFHKKKIMLLFCFVNEVFDFHSDTDINK